MTSDTPATSAATKRRVFRVQWRGNNYRHQSPNRDLTDRIVIQRSLVVDLPRWAHRLLRRIKP